MKNKRYFELAEQNIHFSQIQGLQVNSDKIMWPKIESGLSKI